jgi:hypothetical protein
LESLASAEDMAAALSELFAETEPLPGDQELFDLENRLALLNLIATAPVDARPVYLLVRGFPDGAPSAQAAALVQHYLTAWASDLSVEVERVEPSPEAPAAWGVLVKGFHARALVAVEAGTHLFLPKHGGPVPVRVDVVDEWPATVPDPFAFGPIVRVYPEGQPVADVRTGLVSPLPGRAEFAETFRAFALSALRTNEK